MKKLFVLIALFLLGLPAESQTKPNQKIEPVGDLFEVTIYYDNGQVMQHGFLTRENELHASWESYYENGNRKCIATYDHGAKVGTWFYYYYDKKTKVVYDNNKIVEVQELPLE
jgi:antitoxin component YwqK of YwqJK toxin-antitoxin module